MHRRNPPRDPYWITTRYPAKSADGATIPAGTQAFYFPNTKTTLFGDQAKEAAARFEAERADEDTYSAGYGV